MLKPFIAKAINRQNLSAEEAEQAMAIIMTGQATQAQIGAYLVAMRMKGETIEEIWHWTPERNWPADHFQHPGAAHQPGGRQHPTDRGVFTRSDRTPGQGVRRTGFTGCPGDLRQRGDGRADPLRA
jgi:hypothetical protein